MTLKENLLGFINDINSELSLSKVKKMLAIQK